MELDQTIDLETKSKRLNLFTSLFLILSDLLQRQWSDWIIN